MEIVTTAAGIVGKMAAKPLSDAALRKEAVVRTLKAVGLSPGCRRRTSAASTRTR